MNKALRHRNDAVLSQPHYSKGIRSRFPESGQKRMSQGVYNKLWIELQGFSYPIVKGIRRRFFLARPGAATKYPALAMAACYQPSAFQHAASEHNRINARL